MDYYDLVDTLVHVRTSNGLVDYLKNLANAGVKHRPRGSFKVLTAQPSQAANIARGLVKELFPNALGTHVVGNTAGKIAYLRNINATSYTDNDPAVRKAIAKALPDLKLYRISNGVRVAD